MAKAVQSQADKNLELWNHFCETDKNFTREFTRGKFTGTAINPTYIARRLTERFGPCGQGWRLNVLRVDTVTGAPIFVDWCDTPVGHTVLAVVQGRLAYYENGEWHQTGEQYGQTTMVGQRFDGSLFTDEESFKKSVTDCLAKCAAMLGVSADIYLGTFDGNKYINDPAEDGKDVSPADALKNARTKGTRNKAADTPPVSPATTPDDKPKRGRAKKAAEPAAVDSGETNFVYSELPTGYAYWLPEQWSEFYDSISNPELLATSFTAMTELNELVEDANTFEGLCKQVADVTRKLTKTGSPEYKRMADLLKGAKALLAS